MENLPFIESYRFGEMIVNGRKFTSDVIIFPDHVDDSWWRDEGHRLIPGDLPFLEEEPPGILVVGQGKFGFMKVSAEMVRYLKENDIALKCAKTDQAVKIYNSLREDPEIRVVGAFHLTC